MTGAAPDWLEARAPHDDTARQQSLPLLDAAAEGLLAATAPGEALTVVDLGAGTGRASLAMAYGPERPEGRRHSSNPPLGGS